MKRKIRNNHEDDSLEISLTPLIDTVLVLLIVFIAAAPIINQSIKVMLPNGSLSECNDKKDDVCIAVDQYGRIFNTNKKNITVNEFIEDCSRRFYNNSNISVIIFADKDCIFGHIAELVDKTKELGVKNVYFKTKKISNL